MSRNISFTHGPLRLAMDFLEADERTGAVQARFLIEYTGLRQRVSWSLDSAWIECSALSAFEGQLHDGDEATLVDMSEYVVFSFSRESGLEHLRINPPAERSSTDGAVVALDLRLETGSMDSFRNAFGDFPKWW